MNELWAAVWGFGSTGSAVGILGTFGTREEAADCVRDYLSREMNPAAGAWVHRRCQDCVAQASGLCRDCAR